MGLLQELIEDIGLFLRARRHPALPIEPYIHPRFGTFQEFESHAFYGSVPIEWMGQTIELWPATHVEKLGKQSIERIDPEGFAVAETLLSDQGVWHDRLKAVILRDCYPMWQENWWQGQGPELSPSEFWDRLEVQALNCGFADEFTFDVDAADLFGEHTIVAHGSLSGGMEEADYEG